MINRLLVVSILKPPAPRRCGGIQTTLFPQHGCGDQYKMDAPDIVAWSTCEFHREWTGCKRQAILERTPERTILILHPFA